MYIRFLFVMMLLFCDFVFPAPAGHEIDEAWPEPRPLGKEFSTYRPPSGPETMISSTSLEEPAGTLTLREALALALMRNPELAAFSWEVRAAEARTLQAGLIPNPELGFEAENFGGKRDFRGFASTESTIELGQLIELGGKRAKRKRVALLERDLAGWDYETKRLDVFTEATQAFVNVVALQERLILAQELVRLAEEVQQSAIERVKAGKVSPIEETKAGVTLSTNQIELEKVSRALNAARSRLAALWGSTTSRFQKVEGDLLDVSPVPVADQLAKLVSNNPDVARWVVELEQRKAVVTLEKAKSIPDPLVGVGVRRFNDVDESAFVAGVSIPIPLFDRNQGGKRESRYRLVQAEQIRKSIEVRVRADLTAAYEDLSAAFAEVTALRNNVLPGAQSAFDAAVEGYRQGKFGYLDVLDAQRTLFEAKGGYIEALQSYHNAVAVVERLIGTPLSDLKEKESVQ